MKVRIAVYIIMTLIIAVLLWGVIKSYLKVRAA